MNRIVYLAAECLFVWLLLAGTQFGFLYFLTDFGALWQLLSLVLAVGAIPVAIKWVVLRPGDASIGMGLYAPVRPIATLRQAGLFESDEAGRLRFAFGYDDPRGRDAMDIVAMLAGELRRQGVPHSNAGFLRVQDGGSKWVVEPSLKDPSLVGWVEADRSEDRRQVVDGIRDFLANELGLKLVEAIR